MSMERPTFHPKPEVKEHLRPLTEADRRQLGNLVRIAMERDDLDAAVATQVETTGVTNPNVLHQGLFIGEGELPMSEDKVYRSVDRRAIEDLAESGVVRGAFTATEGQRANTTGHSTHWNKGSEQHKLRFNTDAHVIIEANRKAAEQGWVKATDIHGVHARGADGQPVDITKL